jgi:SP family sugar:H+ symporter-like MFS transporter
MGATTAVSPARPQINIGFVVLISVAAALGGFLFGFDSAVVNGAVPGIQVSFNSTSAQLGFQVASLLLGAALGGLLAGRLADRIGRKRTMLIAGILFLVTAVLSGLSPSGTAFTFFRFFSGMGVGMASLVAPEYISEVAPAAIRGRLTSLQQLGIVVGILIAFLADYGITQAAGGVNNPFWFGLEAWRCMFLTEAIPAAVYILASLFVPESPRYLVFKKRDAEALAVLKRIDASQGEDNVAEIRKSVVSDHKPSMRDLRGPAGKIVPIVWVGIALAALQQLVGINVIFYYGTTLWEAVGFSSTNSLQINVISGAINIIATITAILLVDRVGRRPLLLIGSIGMTVMLATMVLMFMNGTTNAQGQVTLPSPYNLIALVAANAYVFFFGFTWGPVMWVMLGEMFPNMIRGAALSVAVTAQWLANWLVTVTFPSILNIGGPGFAYALYAIFAAISIFFVVRYVKETKGRTLEQMQEG